MLSAAASVGDALVVDARFRGQPARTGVHEWAHELLAALPAHGVRPLEMVPHNGSGIPGHAWEQFVLPGSYRAQRSVLPLLSPCNWGPLAVRRQAIVIHDVAPLMVPEHFHSRYVSLVRAALPALARRVQTILTVSEASRRDIISQLHVPAGKVYVVGVGTRMLPAPQAEVARGLPRCYFAFVGAHDARKNLAFLLELWPRVFAQTGAHLVVTRRPSMHTTISSTGTDRPWYHELLSPNDAALAAVLTNAQALLWPSFYEGFGMPLLEAYRVGTGFVSTDSGVAAELALPHDAVLALDPAVWAKAIVARAGAQEDDSVRSARKTAAGRYVWNDVARRVVEALRSSAVATRSAPTRRPGTSRPEVGRMPTSTPLRVVYLDHCAKLSGAEIALLRLLEALGDNIEPIVILGEGGPLVERLQRVGARVEVVAMPSRVADVTRQHVGLYLDPGAVARAAAYSARLVPLLRDLKPDLVHTNSLKAGFYGVPAARVAGLPVLWHLRDHVSPDYMSPAAVRIVRAAIRTLPTAVVANSSATLATAPRARRGRVVANAVPIPRSSPSSRRGGPLRIIVLGRLAHWKGQDVFLDAFADAYPGSEELARIVGSAMFDEESYAEGLRAQADRLGIADRVLFRGFREDIWPELAWADVLVHCSRSPEPFGQVVVEGLAVGLAVIASDAGAPADILTDGRDGLLVPPGDTRALTAAMLRLADPALRAKLGVAGRRTAAQFSPERASTSMLEVYRSLAVPRTR